MTPAGLDESNENTQSAQPKATPNHITPTTAMMHNMDNSKIAQEHRHHADDAHDKRSSAKKLNYKPEINVTPIPDKSYVGRSDSKLGSVKPSKARSNNNKVKNASNSSMSSDYD